MKNLCIFIGSYVIISYAIIGVAVTTKKILKGSDKNVRVCRSYADTVY